MSIDILQDKIRKLKNPSVVDMTASADKIPPCLMEKHGNFLAAYGEYCTNIMQALVQIVPAVRFRFANFSLYGPEGLALLEQLLKKAETMGFYVFLDCVQIFSPDMAQIAADMLFAEDCRWHFHGLIATTYIGSDGLKPLINKMASSNKSVFGVVRTGNKSAVEVQDLLCGGRLSHFAAADVVNRLGVAMPGRCGYNLVGAVAGASSADSIRILRSKYPKVFMILDGYDYPNANTKNCSFAFDHFGFGAAACACDSVMAAWIHAESDGTDYAQCAANVAQRMKIKLARYVTVL